MQDIGPSDTYITKIPELGDNADIRDALKMYHYGSTVVPVDLDAIESGIAYHLKTINGNVTKKVESPAYPAESGDPSYKGAIAIAVDQSRKINGVDYYESAFLQRVDTNGLEYVLVIDNDEENSSGLKWTTSSKEEERIMHIMGVF